jgi:hypothetical protein
MLLLCGRKEEEEEKHSSHEEVGKNSMVIADAERAQRCAVSSQPRGDGVPKRPAL